MARKSSKGPGVKKTVEPWVPTLERLMTTIAGHSAHIMTYGPGPTVTDRESVYLGCGVGGWEGTDCPFAFFQSRVHRVEGSEPWGPWAQVKIGDASIGNRHAALAHYAALCAPVVAWVAAYWAARATVPSVAPDATARAS